MKDIQEMNQLIWSMGVKFRSELTRAAGPTPTQFPVSQSFTLAATHHFLTLPDAVSRTLEQTTPEEIAQRGKRLGSGTSPLTLWMLGYLFLVGREIVIDLGEMGAQARTDQVACVLDFWRRLVFAYRGDGHLDNSEAGAANAFLPAATVEQLYKALIPVDAGIKRQVKRFFSTLEDYLFLLNAEAHLAITDSGPYPLNVERVLIVREFLDLLAEQSPWHEAAADLPYRTCALAFTLDPADFQSIALSDRSALLTAPPEYANAIREIAFVGSSNGPWRVLPFPEMERLARTVTKVQPRLLEWFARLSRREQIVHGALPWILRPQALVAAGRAPGWGLDSDALRLLAAYEKDEAVAVRWATQRCLAPGTLSAFVPLA